MISNRNKRDILEAEKHTSWLIDTEDNGIYYNLLECQVDHQ